MKDRIRILRKIQTVFVMGILFLLYTLVTLYFPVSLDLSEEKMYSFTPALQEYLEEYSRELKIYSFLTGRSPQVQQFRNFLDELTRLNPLITVHHGHPRDAAQYLEDFRGLLREDSFLLLEGDRRRVISGIDRTHFLRQLYLFCNQVELKVGYLTGYEQLPLHDREQSRFALDIFRTIMENNGLEVEQITFEQLLSEPYYLVLLVSPILDISPRDMQYLEMYWNYGGNILLALDPELRFARDRNLPIFIREKWGLHAAEGVIVQHTPMDIFLERDPLKIRIDDIIHPFFAQHFREYGEIALRISTAFVEVEENPAVRIPLYQTSEHTFLQRDIERLLAGNASYDPETDLPSPLYPAYAVEQEGNRALLFADSDWLTNQMIFESNNYDFVQTVIRYFAPEVKTIGQMPGAYPVNPMTWNTLTRRRIFMTAGIMLFFALSALVWNILQDRRR